MATVLAPRLRPIWSEAVRSVVFLILALVAILLVLPAALVAAAT
jgi:hypothetical protein